MTTLRFDSTDIGRTEAFLSRAYAKIRIAGGGERTRAQVTRDAADAFSIDELSFDFDMGHKGLEPLGRISLCSVLSGGIVRRYHPEATEGTFGSGDLFMYTPHDRPYAGVIHRAHYNLVLLDPGLLTDVASTESRRRPQPVRLTGDRPVSPAAARRLRATIAHVRDNVLRDPTCQSSPLIVSAATQLLAASVLSTFPNNATIALTTADRRDAHPATMRRALAYIDAHAAEPITLADIATAAGTSSRAVQAAFRRHRGSTPMTYLRQVRLDGAHRDLQRADPTSGDTVAEIASRWGFTPSARFTDFYEQQYGELPSHTLRH